MEKKFPPRLVIKDLGDKFHARLPLGKNGTGNYISKEEHNAIVKPLVEALEWYANKNNYKEHYIITIPGNPKMSDVQYEKGMRAKRALNTYKKQTGE